MRKENEKSINKKQMAEHMINSIDGKYIKQAADYKAKNNRNAESSGKARNAIYAEIVKAVSYTHLDVYKRQEQCFCLQHYVE